MLRAIVFAAAIGGVAAGALVSVAQSLHILPLIHEAETYESTGAHGHGHSLDPAATPGEDHDLPAAAAGEDHDLPAAEAGEEGWAPEDGFERTAYTIGANFLTAIAYALLLSSALGFFRRQGWHQGLIWGLGGFAAFALAPALGLPPEIPGAATVELSARQVWWIGTAAATAASLGLITLTRRLHWAVLGVGLLALPHIIGAPQPEAHGGLAPDSLAQDFAAASLVTNLLFWAVLGLVTGSCHRRFALPD